MRGQTDNFVLLIEITKRKTNLPSSSRIRAVRVASLSRIRTRLSLTVSTTSNTSIRSTTKSSVVENGL